jgi:hypothetical protein
MASEADHPRPYLPEWRLGCAGVTPRAASPSRSSEPAKCGEPGRARVKSCGKLPPVIRPRLLANVTPLAARCHEARLRLCRSLTASIEPGRNAARSCRKRPRRAASEYRKRRLSFIEARRGHFFDLRSDLHRANGISLSTTSLREFRDFFLTWRSSPSIGATTSLIRRLCGRGSRPW